MIILIRGSLQDDFLTGKFKFTVSNNGITIILSFPCFDCFLPLFDHGGGITVSTCFLSEDERRKGEQNLREADPSETEY